MVSPKSITFGKIEPLCGVADRPEMQSQRIFCLLKTLRKCPSDYRLSGKYCVAASARNASVVISTRYTCKWSIWESTLWHLSLGHSRWSLGRAGGRQMRVSARGAPVQGAICLLCECAWRGADGGLGGTSSWEAQCGPRLWGSRRCSGRCPPSPLGRGWELGLGGPAWRWRGGQGRPNGRAVESKGRVFPLTGKGV